MHRFIHIKKKKTCTGEHTQKRGTDQCQQRPLESPLLSARLESSHSVQVPSQEQPVEKKTTTSILHLSQLPPSVCIIHIKRMLASIILRCCEFQDIITSIIAQPLWRQYTDEYSYDTLVQTKWFCGHMWRYVLRYKIWQIYPWFTSGGSQDYS